MIKKTLIAVFGLVCLAAPVNSAEVQWELFDLELPERENGGWKLANEDVDPLGIVVREWVPENQSLKSWSEVATVFFISNKVFLDPPETAEEYLETVVEPTLQKKWPGVVFRRVRNGQDDLLVEWAMSCQNREVEHELLRLVWTENGIHRIAYTRRGEVIDEKETARWFQRLQRAKRIPYQPGS